MSQVVVVGGAAPADKLRIKKIWRRIAWNHITTLSAPAARKAIYEVLREIKARRYANRKTRALMHNLEYLKQYRSCCPKCARTPGTRRGPKGFLCDVANQASSVDKIALVMKLEYVKHKGARDFLTTGFGLVNDRIALDSRILSVLDLLHVEYPEGVTTSRKRYENFERMLLDEVCEKLHITGAQFDQLIFTNYDDVRPMLEDQEN